MNQERFKSDITQMLFHGALKYRLNGDVLLIVRDYLTSTTYSRRYLHNLDINFGSSHYRGFLHQLDLAKERMNITRPHTPIPRPPETERSLVIYALGIGFLIIGGGLVISTFFTGVGPLENS